jgi:hypothetical protein
MAIKTLEQKKRQQILLIVALGVLIIAALILYFGFWKSGGGLPEEGLEITAGAGDEQIGSRLGSEARIMAIDLDFDFLNETVLSFLKIHGAIPVEKGQTGRTNPFIHY